MNRPKRLAALWWTSLLVAALAAGPATAAAPPDPAPGARYELAAAGISLQQAVRKVRRATGGRVLSAGPAEVDGRPAYRVKVLMPGGRVRVVLVDARSGALLNY